MDRKQASVPLFALRDIGKKYGSAYACRQVSFEIFAGDVIGLAGENGAGKSTSMKCLAGWIAPTDGHIEVEGMRRAFLGPRDAERVGIAVIPQELDLFPELAIYENIFAGLKWPRTRYGFFDRRQMKTTARGLLGKLGASFDISRPVKSLSPANQKLVEIARALNRDARLLIMDEPTAALTEMESSRLFRVIRDLQAQGTAVIHITHRLDEIFEHCNRVVVLRDGAMVANGAIEEFDTASLIKAMVGRPVEQFYVRKFRGTPGDILLEVRNLSRGRVFQDVSLTVRAGEVLGVAGLIGAGRTEIAHAIAGVRQPGSGEIRIKGEPVRIRSVAGSKRHGIAYLPEERRSQGLHLPFPIAWNVSFGALERVTRGGFISSPREIELAETSVREFVIRAASVDMPVGSLSGGNQQKVLLAKILAKHPEIVILDEPTRGVDVGAKAEIYSLIEDLVKAGKAVMLISSEIEEILSLSDRIATVYHGRINGILHRNQFSAEAVGYAVSGQVQHA